MEERRGKSGLYTVTTSNLSIDDLEKYWRPEGVTLGEFHESMHVTDRLRERWRSRVLVSERFTQKRHERLH